MKYLKLTSKIFIIAIIIYFAMDGYKVFRTGRDVMVDEDENYAGLYGEVIEADSVDVEFYTVA